MLFFATYVAMRFLGRTWEIWIVLFLGLILASTLRPLVLGLERRMSRTLAVLAVYISIIILIGASAALIVPPLIAQLGQLVTGLPGYSVSISRSFQALQDWLTRIGVAVNLREQLRQVLGYAAGRVPQLLRFGLTIAEVIVGSIGVFFISLYWLLERDHVLCRLTRLLPEERQTRFPLAFARMEGRLGRWVLGQIILSAAVGILAFIALLLLGVPYALPLAIFAGLTEVVPIVGPFIGGFPAVLVGFSRSVWLGLVIAAVYFGIQELEGHILVPQVQHFTVRINPLVIVVAILFGGALAGILGVLVAIPLAVLVTTVLEEIFAREDSVES